MSPFAKWWKTPEQSFLRGEIRWTLRWLGRPAGVFVLVVLVGLDCLLLPLAIPVGGGRLIGNPSPQRLALAAGLARLVVYWWTWLHLIRLRADASRLDPRDAAGDPRRMWPALLAAPILFAAGWRLVELFVVFAAWMSMGEARSIAAPVGLWPFPLVFAILPMIPAAGWPWLALLGFLDALLVPAALTAYVACWMIRPWDPSIRLFAMAWGQALLASPPLALGFWVVSRLSHIYKIISDGRAHPYSEWQYHLMEHIAGIAILGCVLRLLMAGVMYWLCVKALRRGGKSEAQAGTLGVEAR